MRTVLSQYRRNFLIFPAEKVQKTQANTEKVCMLDSLVLYYMGMNYDSSQSNTARLDGVGTFLPALSM